MRRDEKKGGITKNMNSKKKKWKRGIKKVKRREDDEFK